MVVNIAIGLCAFLLLLIPGIAVALTWSPRIDEQQQCPLFHVALALAWGFGLVPFIAFCWALFTMDPLTPWVTACSSAFVTGFSVWWWIAKKGRVIPDAIQWQHWKPAVFVLLACLAVGLIYILKYDRSIFFLESCIHRVVMQTLQMTDNPIDILASNNDDQRLGNTAVISSFVVLFRTLGFRLLYGFVGFSIALGGFLLARRVLGSQKWGWFALIALPLNPYVAKIPLLDENLLTLGFSSLVLPLLFRPSVPWGHVGAIFGLTVMMRHTGILCAPAIVWALLQYPRKRKQAALFCFLTFSLVTAVAHIHHYVALGSVFRFESFGQIPEFSHRFIGEYSGLLQWPFADQIIRTPWNPFPTFLMWPVYLAHHLGIVLFSAAIIGVLRLIQSNRKEGVFWLLWFTPLFGALSLQENWDVPNKMGVIYVLFHPIILWSAAGLRAAMNHRRSWGIGLIVCALVSGFGIRALNGYHAVQDVRYYQAWPGEREEDFDYVAAERERVTDVAPWPDYREIGSPERVFNPQKVAGLFRDIANPGLKKTTSAYGWFDVDFVDFNATPVVIELDLSARPFDNDQPVIRQLPGETEVHLDLTQETPPVVVPNLKVNWSPRPVSLLFTGGGASVTAATLLFERWGSSESRLAYLAERYHRGLMMVMGYDANTLNRMRVVNHTDTKVRIRVPSGPFSLIESVNNAGQNYLLWQARLDALSEVTVHGPHRVFHN